MDSIEHHKKQVAGIKAEHVFSGGGAEQEVYSKPDVQYVIKISTGTLMEISADGTIIEQQFNPEQVPNPIRRKLIAQHLLSKILHILKPDSVPDRSELYTKSFPRFKQVKISGKKEHDDVPRRVKETVVHPAAVTSGGAPAPKFRIKETRIMEIAPEGLKARETWDDAIRAFTITMNDIGVKIDTQNMFENFIKTPEGNYQYIDQFSFPDGEKIAEKLSGLIADGETSGRIPHEKARRAKLLVQRFFKLAKQDQS